MNSPAPATRPQALPRSAYRVLRLITTRWADNDVNPDFMRVPGGRWSKSWTNCTGFDGALHHDSEAEAVPLSPCLPH